LAHSGRSVICSEADEQTRSETSLNAGAALSYRAGRPDSFEARLVVSPLSACQQGVSPVGLDRCLNIRTLVMQDGRIRIRAELAI
jgi:hypothetical protein